MFRRKFRAINAFIKKKKKTKINNLTFNLKVEKLIRKVLEKRRAN